MTLAKLLDRKVSETEVSFEYALHEDSTLRSKRSYRRDGTYVQSKKIIARVLQRALLRNNQNAMVVWIVRSQYASE